VTSTKPTDDQKKRFIETARALECDEDKERFEGTAENHPRTNPLSREGGVGAGAFWAVAVSG
jgi:hypothetical protein